MDNAIKLRLKDYCRYKKLSISALAEQCDMNKSVLSRIGETTDEATLAKIESNADINVDWLMTGDGEMLRSNGDENRGLIENTDNTVPLLPVPALANSLSEYIGEGLRKLDCQNILSPSPGAEVAIPVSGDSMEPKFHDGSILFLKRINDKAFIPWGHTVVLDTENGAYIKTIFESDTDDGIIEARSINPAYPVLKIPKSSVFGIYRILNATKFFTTM